MLASLRLPCAPGARRLENLRFSRFFRYSRFPVLPEAVEWLLEVRRVAFSGDSSESQKCQSLWSVAENLRLDWSWQRSLMWRNAWICFRISSSFVGNNPSLRLQTRTTEISKVGSACILPICKIWTLHYSAYWFWGLHIILHIVACICKIICKIRNEICKKIVQGSYSAYSAYCNMQNMQIMSNNMLQYANQYAKYAIKYAKKIVQGSYSAYSAYYNKQNMQNIITAYSVYCWCE